MKVKICIKVKDSDDMNTVNFHEGQGQNQYEWQNLHLGQSPIQKGAWRHKAILNYFITDQKDINLKKLSFKFQFSTFVFFCAFGYHINQKVIHIITCTLKYTMQKTNTNSVILCYMYMKLPHSLMAMFGTHSMLYSHSQQNGNH